MKLWPFRKYLLKNFYLIIFPLRTTTGVKCHASLRATRITGISIEIKFIMGASLHLVLCTVNTSAETHY